MMKRLLTCILIILCLLIPTAQVSAEILTTKKAVLNAIKDGMLQHKKEIVIEMDKSVMEKIGTKTNLFEAVVALDDKKTSKDFDYLRLSIYQWKAGWKWTKQGKTATLTFAVTYRTTLKQEKAVDDKIKSLLKSWKLEDASDYEKVKKVHDYIIKRVAYDQTYQKYSAYDALINKSSVCEGYATAAYRLFTELGLESRIVTGWAGVKVPVAHAWNIVKVDGKWYNIDLTWDDPITNTGEQILIYDYFLKNEEDFKYHYRDDPYTTKEFLKAYPIAEESYVMPE